MLLHVSPSPLSLHVPCVSPSPSSSRSGLRIPSPPPLPPPSPPSRQGRWLSTTRSSHYDGRGSKGRTTPPFYEEEEEEEKEEEEEDGAGAEEEEDGEEENSIAMATSIQAYPSSNSSSGNSRINSTSSGGGGKISNSSSGDGSSGGGRISSSSASASRRALLISGVLGFGALSLSPAPFSAVLSSLKEGAVATESAIKEGSGVSATVKDGGGATGKDVAPAAAVAKEEGKRKEVFRVYDSTALGEPVPIGKDKGRVWQKLLAARVVYLGESERVPDPDDKVLELDILQTLRDKCFEQQRPVSLAMQAIPCNLQTQLNQYASKRITDEQLRASLHHWSDGRWTEYLPILHYCRNNGVRLMACGTPLEVLRTVQAKGLQGISDAESRKYVPPAGGNNINYSLTMQQLSLEDVLPNVSVPFGPGPYNFAQARMVEDYTMSQVVLQATADGGVVGLLIVIVGASHVVYGSKGSGLPARISKRLQKKTQAVVLLNPERQRIRREGDVAEADFLWYSAAKPCVRNCFDRAEVARVMDAAGRRRDALPQDLQTGLDLGLVPPEVLESFLNLEKQPFIADLTNRFQGVRERWLADPRFLQRLAIEESISITTTLIAQYERRKGRFFEELDYVITDTVRGAVVDFFTVWLPAPTLSFRSPTETAEAANNILGSLAGLQSILGSFPDNAFQRATRGENWGIKARIGSVIVGGLKLFFVGFVSSVGTLAISNTLLDVRQRWNSRTLKPRNKRSPVLKTAFVYGSFLGTSANLRYQAIAGLVEHWVADFFLESHPLAGSVLSFAARTLNSYFGTQQWVDLARLTGLQGHGKEEKENVVMKNASSENTGGDGLEATTPATDSKESFDNNASWNLPPPPIEQVMKGTEHMVGTHLQNKDSDK